MFTKPQTFKQSTESHLARSLWASFCNIMAFPLRMYNWATPDRFPGFFLPRAELIEIRLLGDRRITCASGSVWITRDHDAADYLLGPGESFCMPNSRNLVIEGLRDSELRVVEGRCREVGETGIEHACRDHRAAVTAT